MTETSVDIARRMFEEGYELQQAGELEDAIRLYQASISFYPTAEAHTYLGWAYSMKGLYEEAIAECKNAIEVDPTYGNPYNDIGAYLIAQERWSEAIEWLKKAIEAPRYEHRAFPYINLARIYQHFGHPMKALRALRKAWKVDRSHLTALDMYQEMLGKLN